jgi:hypothetical protein
VSVVAGKPIDVSRWEGAVPSRAVLDEMTDTIMTAVRDQLAGIRHAEPPPLHPAPARRPEPPKAERSAKAAESTEPPKAAGSAEPPKAAGSAEPPKAAGSTEPPAVAG